MPNFSLKRSQQKNQQKNQRTSLDSNKNNCNKWIWLNTATGEIARFKCNSWYCKECAERKRKWLIRRIGEWAEHKKTTRLMTLTLDPKRVRGESYFFIQQVWRKFRVYMYRQFKKVSFIWVVEAQKNGMAHLHVLVSCYIPQNWISKTWEKLGGGKIVDIRYVDVQRVRAYLAKYLGKDWHNHKIPKGKRRYGSSRDITLLIPPQFPLFPACLETGLDLAGIRCSTCAGKRKCKFRMSRWVLIITYRPNPAVGKGRLV